MSYYRHRYNRKKPYTAKEVEWADNIVKEAILKAKSQNIFTEGILDFIGSAAGSLDTAMKFLGIDDSQVSKTYSSASATVEAAVKNIDNAISEAKKNNNDELANALEVLKDEKAEEAKTAYEAYAKSLQKNLDAIVGDGENKEARVNSYVALFTPLWLSGFKK